MKRSNIGPKTYEEALAKKKIKTFKMALVVTKHPLKTKKAKKVRISTLKKKADAIFSQFIRIRDNGKCYTCSLQKPWKEMQNGHFVPRQYLSVRYNVKNCHCQCYACNMLYNGQPSAYAQNLKRDYGESILEELEGKRKELTIWREPEYNALITKYTELVAQFLDINV